MTEKFVFGGQYIHLGKVTEAVYVPEMAEGAMEPDGAVAPAPRLASLRLTMDSGREIDLFGDAAAAFWLALTNDATDAGRWLTTRRAVFSMTKKEGNDE